MLLLTGGDVVTMNERRDVLLGGTVAVDDDVIVDVGSTAELAARYPGASVIDVGDCVVTPGMIDAHQHLTGDPLVRCCIPDLIESGSAIFDWSVPIHAAHESLDDEISASVAAVEALCNGVTTVVEAGTVADGDAVGRALGNVGIRATLGVWGWDIEDGPFAAPAPEVLDRQRALIEKFPSGGRVEGWVTLVGHDLASDELLAGAADLARELGTGMTMHLSPTSSDPERYLERTGRRPVAHLDRLGVLGSHLLIGHGVWLDDEEVELILASDTAIAYCPWAYLRLGQGVFANSRHAEIVERGGRVALGCDAGTPVTPSTSCGWRPWRRGSPGTPASIPPGSEHTRCSNWRPSPAPVRSAWASGSARSRSVNRPTSSSTAPTPPAGHLGGMSVCNSCGEPTVAAFGTSSSPGATSFATVR